MNYYTLDTNNELGAWALDESISLGEAKQLIGNNNIKKVTQEEYEAIALADPETLDEEDEENQQWNVFVENLQNMSITAFSREYTESELVNIANNAPIELPEFLKSTSGPVSIKREWYQENKQSLIQ